MVHPRRITSFAVFTLAACGVSGCSTDGGSPGEEALGASPAETAWMDKHARFNAAIEGVSFDSGSLTVVEALAGDLDQAMEFRNEGDAHYREGRYIEATAAHVRAIRMAPEFAAGYVSMGHAVLGHGKVDFAAAAWRTAVELEPENVEARFNLAHSLWMLSESDAAIAEMEEVIARDPANAAAYERLAIWRYYAGDDAAAWRNVHAAQALGHGLPPQFLDLLAARTPDPGPPIR